MRIFALIVALIAAVGCSSGNEADEIGVGAACATADDCNQEDGEQSCLTQFKGGYCGLQGCEGDADCPDAAGCVTHEGANYCFRLCTDKAECNANRPADSESNCSSSTVFADGTKSGKACLPPSK